MKIFQKIRDFFSSETKNPLKNIENSREISDSLLVTKIRAKFAELDQQMTDIWGIIEKHQEQIRKYQLKLARERFDEKVAENQNNIKVGRFFRR